MSDHLSTDLARLLKLALTCGSEELYLLVQENSSDVLHAVLKNPACTESHLLALLKRRDLREDLLKAMCGHPIAQESHRVTVAIVHHPATAAPQLSSLLPRLQLFELVALCQLPGATADMKMAAERVIIQRLPAVPLGSKISLARRAEAQVLDALLKGGEPQVIAPCLDNPRLKEGSLYQLVKSGAATAETLSLIVRHPRWQSRPNLKMAILANPRTPPVWLTRFLSTLTIAELKQLMTAGITATQKSEIRQELKRRGV
jgi:hypothetical protein